MTTLLQDYTYISIKDNNMIVLFRNQNLAVNFETFQQKHFIDNAFGIGFL